LRPVAAPRYVQVGIDHGSPPIRLEKKPHLLRRLEAGERLRCQPPWQTILGMLDHTGCGGANLHIRRVATDHEIEPERWILLTARRYARHQQAQNDQSESPHTPSYQTDHTGNHARRVPPHPKKQKRSVL